METFVQARHRGDICQANKRICWSRHGTLFSGRPQIEAAFNDIHNRQGAQWRQLQVQRHSREGLGMVAAMVVKKREFDTLFNLKVIDYALLLYVVHH